MGLSIKLSSSVYIRIVKFAYFFPMFINYHNSDNHYILQPLVMTELPSEINLEFVSVYIMETYVVQLFALVMPVSYYVEMLYENLVFKSLLIIFNSYLRINYYY